MIDNTTLFVKTLLLLKSRELNVLALNTDVEDYNARNDVINMFSEMLGVYEKNQYLEDRGEEPIEYSQYYDYTVEKRDGSIETRESTLQEILKLDMTSNFQFSQQTYNSLKYNNALSYLFETANKKTFVYFAQDESNKAEVNLFIDLLYIIGGNTGMFDPDIEVLFVTEKKLPSEANSLIENIPNCTLIKKSMIASENWNHFFQSKCKIVTS